MRYINKKTNEVVWLHKIRLANPNISIPDNADLTGLGYIKVEDTEMPVQEGFYAVEVEPVDYKQTWVLVPIVEEIPQSVTRLQAKLALLDIGMLDAVEVLLNNDRRAKIYWEDAVTLERQNPTLLGMASSLNLTEQDLDNLFLAASKIVA